MIVRNTKIDSNDISFENKVSQITDYLKIPNNRWEALSKLKNILQEMASPYPASLSRYQDNQWTFSMVNTKNEPQIGDACKTFVMDFDTHQCYSFDTKIDAFIFGHFDIEFNKDNLVNKQDVGPQNLDIKKQMGGNWDTSDKIYEEDFEKNIDE